MSAVPKRTPAVPAAWTLRDEFAMRALAALVVKGDWGCMAPDGTRKTYSNMAEYSVAAYEFADHMLRAREVA